LSQDVGLRSEFLAAGRHLFASGSRLFGHLGDAPAIGAVYGIADGGFVPGFRKPDGRLRNRSTALPDGCRDDGVPYIDAEPATPDFVAACGVETDSVRGRPSGAIRDGV
jgi:hypothetical protein